MRRSPHLPRPDLAQLIGQRQRVLRGREETRWEKFCDWWDGVELDGLLFTFFMTVGFIHLVALYVWLVWKIFS